MEVDKFLVFSSDVDDSRYSLTNTASNFITSLPFQKLELTDGSKIRITSVEYPKNWKFARNDTPNDERFMVLINLFDMMFEPIGYTSGYTGTTIKSHSVAPFSFLPKVASDRGGLHTETKLFTEWHTTRPMTVDRVHVRIVDCNGRDIVFYMGNVTVTIEVTETESGEFPMTHRIPVHVTR